MHSNRIRSHKHVQCYLDAALYMYEGVGWERSVTLGNVFSSNIEWRSKQRWIQGEHWVREKMPMESRQRNDLGRSSSAFRKRHMSPWEKRPHFTSERPINHSAYLGLAFKKRKRVSCSKLVTCSNKKQTRQEVLNSFTWLLEKVKMPGDWHGFKSQLNK